MNPETFRSSILVVFFGLITAAIVAAQAPQAADAESAELKLLRSTNARLVKENEALKSEVVALKKQLTLGEGTTTRPAAMSNTGAAAGGAKRVVFILDATGSILNLFDAAREQLQKKVQELNADQMFAVV